MTPRTLSVVAIACFTLTQLGCGKSGDPAPAVATGPTQPEADTTVAKVKPTPTEADTSAATPAPNPAAQAVTTKAPVPTDEKPAPGKARPQLTSAQVEKAKLDMATFKTLLNEGRKLAKAKDYTAAIAKFDAANRVVPGHPSAAAEHGWAAFNAGQLEIAERMTRMALASAKKPKRKAAVLYNLGRVLEARGEAEEARKLYERSLSLRPNKVVQARVATLAGAKPGAAIADVDAACAKAMAEWDCTPGGGMDGEFELADCSCVATVTQGDPEVGGIKAAAFLKLDGQAGHGGALDGSEFLAVQGPSGAWVFAGLIANNYTPGVSYITNNGSAELDLGDHLDAPGAELIVKTTNNTFDGDPGINSFDNDTTMGWLLCRVVSGSVRCLSFAYGGEFESGPLDESEDGETVESAWELSFTLDRSGSITLDLPNKDAEVAPDDAIAMKGTHTLKALEKFEAVEVLTK
ncbi:MAG: tetratricopeptide (TPR) repeat protein [Myxococcota bacterium]|jgi:tetratricopeptide (TPR) repeat protein